MSNELQSNYNNICRLCAMQHENGIELYSDGSEKWDQLVHVICKYLQLDPKQYEQYPKWLCVACQFEAESTENFLQLVRESQCKLQAIFCNLPATKEIVTPPKEDVIHPKKSTRFGRRRRKAERTAKITHVESILPTNTVGEELINSRKRIRRPPKRFVEDFEHITTQRRRCKEKCPSNRNTTPISENKSPIAELRTSDGSTIAEIVEVELTKSSPATKSHNPYKSKVRLICEHCKEVCTSQPQFLKHLKLHEQPVETAANNRSNELDEPKNDAINIVVGSNGQITSIDPQPSSLNVKHETDLVEEGIASSKVISVPSTFACLFCAKTFKSHYAVRRHHRQVHIGLRNYKCHQCAASFKNKSNYDYHMARHNGKKPYECNICGRSFILKYSLTIHMRLHTGEKPFKCKHCNLSFICRSNLKTHQGIHSGLRPYKCTLCTLTFRTNSHLNKHKEVHLKHVQKDIRQKLIEKSIQSYLGDEKYTIERNPIIVDNDALLFEPRTKRIESTQHEIGVATRKHRSLIKCNTQDTTIAPPLKDQPQILQVKELPPITISEQPTVDSIVSAHSITIGPQRRQINSTTTYKYQCEHCLKRFDLKSTFTKHMRTHTGEKPYKCPFCPKSFSDPSNFKKHKDLHKQASKDLRLPTIWDMNYKRNKIQSITTTSPMMPSPIAPDPDPDGLEISQRIDQQQKNIDTNNVLNELLNENRMLMQTFDDPYTSSAPPSSTSVTATHSNQKQLVYISYQDPTNPVDNKTTFFVVN